MARGKRTAWAGLLLLGGLAAAACSEPRAEPQTAAVSSRVTVSAPQVAAAVKMDRSPPLRLAQVTRGAGGERREIPLLRPAENVLKRRRGVSMVEGGLDLLAVRAGEVGRFAELLAPSPPPLLTFEGSSDADNEAVLGGRVVPPDTVGDVGPNHYVQMINLVFRIFDKDGNTILGPLPTSALFAGFGGPCELNNDGDPIVVYDQLADRWVLSQFAIGAGTQCIAVSQTGDPTGAYYRYAFLVTPGGQNDYPKLGVWPDGYYATFRRFPGFRIVAAAFERDKMLQGLPAQQVLFDLAAPAGPGCSGPGDCYEGVLPSHLEGLTPPPPGTPNYFLMSFDDEAFSTDVVPGADSYRLWRFHVDWADPASSTFSAPITIPATEMDTNLCGFGACVPQLGGEPLASLSFFTMYPLIYRNFGTHEALWANNTVDVGGDRAGIRWVEIRDPGGAPFIHQEGTHAPDDGLSRWMGSLSVDKDGNMAVGYSASGPAAFPSIRYAGRLASDPPGILAQTETELWAGTGSQIDSFNRWGDYSAMSVDDSDGCTFWYTQEYYAVTGAFDFRTRVGAFRFPSCTDAPRGTLTGTVTDAETAAPVANATVQAGIFTTTTDASGSYTLLLPVGTYDVTVSAFGYVTQTVSGVVVDEGVTTSQDIDLVPAPAGSLSGFVVDEAGNAIAGATVRILDTPIPPATTDANGSYVFPSVPTGVYQVNATAGRCNDSQTLEVTIAGDETLDFTLPNRRDAFGYSCSLPAPGYIEAGTVVPLSGDDVSSSITLPFPFTFYGQTYDSANLCTNGFLSFTSAVCPFSNSGIPSNVAPNAAIYAYWDDMVVDGASSVRTELLGTAPNRRFVIEWRDATYFADPSRRVDFEIILHENGRVQLEYRNIADDGLERGNSATIGIEDESGVTALQYSLNEAAIGTPAFALLFQLPPSGIVDGTVTDRNDGLPVAGATVTALQDGTVVRTATTGAGGTYRMQLPLGTYTISATATNYGTETAAVTLVNDGDTARRDFSLRTARGVVSPTALTLIMPANQTRTRTLTLRNTGSLAMSWALSETGVAGPLPTPNEIDIPVGLKNKNWNKAARTTQQVYANGTPPGWPAAAPGDVIDSWAPTGLELAWGVGYTGNVWLSDIPNADRNHEFTVAGVPTGVVWGANFAAAWPADMAYDAGRGLMCQVNVGGDNGIFCWDPLTNTVVDSIVGAFAWTAISQRGLAYRADDDTFYIGGWNEGVLYHVKGLSYPDKGAVIGQCSPPDPNISGLAYNASENIVWAATNSPTDTIYALNPDDCTVLTTLPHPSPEFNGAGLEMDEAGNLWMISQAPNRVYLIDSGVPAIVDLPWLSEEPTSGTVPVGGTQAIALRFDTTGLAPGVYNGRLFITTNSGRDPRLEVDVRLIVSAYVQAVNAGDGVYIDLEGEAWSADQRYAAGSWGYTNNRDRTERVRRDIAGTDDDPLYRTQRINPLEYKFDGLPPGVYEIDLRFALLERTRPNRHLFDVLVEEQYALPAHDIAYEVGSFTADRHVFFASVTDGTLNIRFATRRQGDPIVNAIRVRQRPDR